MGLKLCHYQYLNTSQPLMFDDFTLKWTILQGQETQMFATRRLTCCLFSRAELWDGWKVPSPLILLSSLLISAFLSGTSRVAAGLHSSPATTPISDKREPRCSSETCGSNFVLFVTCGARKKCVECCLDTVTSHLMSHECHLELIISAATVT